MTLELKCLATFAKAMDSLYDLMLDIRGVI